MVIHSGYYQNITDLQNIIIKLHETADLDENKAFVSQSLVMDDGKLHKTTKERLNY